MQEVREWEAALSEWLEPFLDALGHKARRRWAPVYIRGLFGRTERKSVQPIAAELTPGDYDQLHNFVASRSWSSTPLEAILATKADALVGGVGATLVVDDVALLKKGEHSVGVARQYAGVLGKKAPCQVLVSLTLARREVPVPVALRLYLPKDWIGDPDLCRRAGVPDEHVQARTKPEIALAELDRLRALGLRFSGVVADAGYGHSPTFRQALSARHLTWAVGVPCTQSVYTTTAEVTWPVSKAGPKRKRPVASEKPIAAQAMLKTAPWRRVAWRTGTKGPLAGEFAALRVRVADGPPQRQNTPSPGDEAWLIGERQTTGNRRYYLSNLPPDTPLRALVGQIKMRWVCEQGHQQMKEELGLDHFEGRRWHGLHHHAVLVMIALAFLQHLRLANATEREKKARCRQRAATSAHVAGRPASDPCPNSDRRADPMPLLSVLARPAHARIELPK